MTLVELAKEKIESVADTALRKRYSDALRKSYIWEGIGEDKEPTAAQTITDTSGISAKALYETGVLLSKKDVAAYSIELGATITEASVQKRLTATTYVNLFSDDRMALRDGKKLLLTYAEARKFLKIRSKGEL